MKHIYNRKDFIKLAGELGVRPDWHEPDEQEIWVEIRGNNFDNAGFWPESHACKDENGDISVMEMCVFINEGTHDNYTTMGIVNLATLLAWASGYNESQDYRNREVPK